MENKRRFIQFRDTDYEVNDHSDHVLFIHGKDDEDNELDLIIIAGVMHQVNHFSFLAVIEELLEEIDEDMYILTEESDIRGGGRIDRDGTVTKSDAFGNPDREISQELITYLEKQTNFFG